MGFFGVKDIKLLLEDSYYNYPASSSSCLTFVDDKNKDGGFYIYHCARTKAAIENIEQVGNRREWNNSNAGNYYGDGIYSTYTLKSTIYNHDRGTYGREIAKLYCIAPLKKFAIFDGYVCKQYYGHDVHINTQLENIFKGVSIKGRPLIDIIRSYSSQYSDVAKSYADDGFTAYGARALWEIIENIEFKYRFNVRKYIAGLIFSGHNDGNVCVIYDFSKATPVAISRNRGQTFTSNPNIDKWRRNAVFRGGDLVNSLRYEYSYFRTYGFVDGYAIVGQRQYGPYRILSHYLFNRNINGDGRISNLWFDDVQGQSFTSIGKDRVIQVVYKGKRYTIMQDDVEKQQYSVYDNGIYVCDLKDLEHYANQPQQSKPINNNINHDFNLDDADIDDFLSGLNI